MRAEPRPRAKRVVGQRLGDPTLPQLARRVAIERERDQPLASLIAHMPRDHSNDVRLPRACARVHADVPVRLLDAPGDGRDRVLVAASLGDRGEARSVQGAPLLLQLQHPRIHGAGDVHRATATTWEDMVAAGKAFERAVAQRACLLILTDEL